MIESKKQLFRSAVKQAVNDVGLGWIPNVVFYNGYIPNQPTNTEACIDIETRVIYVSETHLQGMDFTRIRQVAIHEISHIFEPSHDGRFDRIDQNIRCATWRPEFTSGIIMSVGNTDYHIQKKVEPKEPVVDKKNCNYHICRKEATLIKCPHCGDYFCADHIKPKSPSAPDFYDHNKNIEWKDSEHTHPCALYYDYLVKKNKEQCLKCSKSLDKMNEISKPKVVVAFNVLEC